MSAVISEFGHSTTFVIEFVPLATLTLLLKKPLFTKILVGPSALASKPPIKAVG